MLLPEETRYELLVLIHCRTSKFKYIYPSSGLKTLEDLNLGDEKGWALSKDTANFGGIANTLKTGYKILPE